MVGFLPFVSTGATLVSVFMLMSPILTMLQLSKNNVLKMALPVMICNTIGSAIATWCVLTYLTIIRVEEKSGHQPAFTYKDSLTKARIAVAIVVIFLVVLLILYNCVTVTAANLLNGLAGGCCSVFMLSSPLAMAKDIIKKKNAEGLQPVTVALATLNSVLWTMYGFLVSPIDPFIFTPNGLCTLACLFQVYLLLRYGRRPTGDKVEVIEAIAPVPV